MKKIILSILLTTFLSTSITVPKAHSGIALTFYYASSFKRKKSVEGDPDAVKLYSQAIDKKNKKNNVLAHVLGFGGLGIGIITLFFTTNIFLAFIPFLGEEGSVGLLDIGSLEDNGHDPDEITSIMDGQQAIIDYLKEKNALELDLDQELAVQFPQAQGNALEQLSPDDYISREELNNQLAQIPGMTTGYINFVAENLFN